MKIIRNLIIATLILNFSCNTTKSKTETFTNVNGEKITKQKIVDAAIHPFKIFEVIEDSRCPINAKCVWEGKLVVKLGAYQDNTRIGERTLDLTNVSPADLDWVNSFLDTNNSKYIYKIINSSAVNEIGKEPLTLQDYKVTIVAQDNE